MAVRRNRLQREVNGGGDYKVRNDLASALMHTGDPKAAIQILEEIEKTNPGLYQTASNLGTAYELAGENEKALEWIRKGIERNPQSHASSEWIHVKILEAKIAHAKADEWPEGGSILGLRFDYDSKMEPSVTLPKGNAGESLSLNQVEASLKYQLHERLQFVKPPDFVVASLLLDLGNIITLESKNRGAAQGIYEIAESYVAPDDSSPTLGLMIQDRLRKARFANQKHSFFADRQSLAILGIVVILFVYVPVRMWTHGRK